MYMADIIRWQVECAKEALKEHRVASISGARQTGKTTLAKQVAGKNGVFRSLDSKAMIAAAKEEPSEFIKNDKGTMIIDEIQKVPQLMNEIKLAVDENRRMGQYLLTGSANIQTVATISDSLAGRITHIRLRPFTIGEMLGKKPDFLKRAFSKDFPIQIRGYDKAKIFDLAFRGGYPEATQKQSEKSRRKWHNDYIDDLINRDLKDIENIKRLDALRSLIKILAGWSGKYMDFDKIGSSMELSRQTLKSYVNALETMFIFESVAPWLKTDYDIVGKKPKFYATDTGLMVSILNWKQDEALKDSDRAGKLMETFVFQELSAQIDLDKYAYSLYQYRDHKKREIDFIVERDDESLIGIEVKAGRNVSKEDFASQIWFRDNIAKGREYIAYVLYSGEDKLAFGKDLIALPIAALWG
jgi:predicted AAA+ superfamily ATPase